MVYFYPRFFLIQKLSALDKGSWSYICRQENHIFFLTVNIKYNLIQNSQAVKKLCGPEKGYGEKRCEIQGGGQEMAVMVG